MSPTGRPLKRASVENEKGAIVGFMRYSTRETMGGGYEKGKKRICLHLLKGTVSKHDSAKGDGPWRRTTMNCSSRQMESLKSGPGTGEVLGVTTFHKMLWEWKESGEKELKATKSGRRRYELELKRTGSYNKRFTRGEIGGFSWKSELSHSPSVINGEKDRKTPNQAHLSRGGGPLSSKLGRRRGFALIRGLSPKKDAGNSGRVEGKHLHPGKALNAFQGRGPHV